MNEKDPKHGFYEFKHSQFHSSITQNLKFLKISSDYALEAHNQIEQKELKKLDFFSIG